MTVYGPRELVPGSWARVLWIPRGDLGIMLTVWQMRFLARRGARDPLLGQLAGSIVAGCEDTTEAAHAIRLFLERVVDFTPDPAGAELLKQPRYAIRELELEDRILGDCDDVAVLGAALGGAVGLPARFVLLAFSHGAPYEHVYTELLTDGGWLELDTTKPHQLPSGLTVVREAIREA